MTFAIPGNRASHSHLAFSFRVGHPIVGLIIKKCCQALWECLIPLALQ